MTEPSCERSPLWKQLLGAGAGALVALGIYGAVKVAHPRLTAYLTTPESRGNYDGEETRLADPTDSEKFRLVLSRQNRAAVEFAKRQEEIAQIRDEQTRAKAEEHRDEQQAKAAAPRESMMPPPRESTAEVEFAGPMDYGDPPPEQKIEHIPAGKLPHTGAGALLGGLLAAIAAGSYCLRRKFSRECIG